MPNLNTDNLHFLAVITLDVRPSSLCVTRITGQHFELQVMRHEVIGRPFDFHVQRFVGILRDRFKGTQLGNLKFDVVVVDELTRKFEEQDPWKVATSPITVDQ